MMVSQKLHWSVISRVILCLALFLSSCKPKSPDLAETAAVPACTVWPSHFMVTKGNIPVFESIDDLEDNKNAKYVGPNTPVIRELTLLNQETNARVMKIVVRGGSLAGEQRWWTLAVNLASRTKSTCPANTPRKCSEFAVHFCDGGGCRCIDAGAAPDSEVGNAIIEAPIYVFGLGPVAFGSRVVGTLRAIRLVPAAVNSVPTTFGKVSINLTKHLADEKTLIKAEEFIATNSMHSYQFARKLIGKNPELKKLDLSEASAINYYTRMGYGDINKALRTGDEALLNKLQPVIEAASSGLTKMVNNAFVGTVYRGAQLPAAVSDVYQVGAKVTEKAFTSTSRSFAGKFTGNTMFVIKSKTGRMVHEFSEFASEQEVLFPPGTVFKVMARTLDGKKVKILLEQMAP